MLINDVTIIIRSVGERTEAACKKMILAQGVPNDNIIIVNESPFSAAMKKSFRLGIGRNLTWTFCVDADVLLRSNSIKRLLSLGNKEKSNICEVQGLVLDKFFGGPKGAGNHLYRTSLLDKAIEQIPQEGTNIRPEHYTLNKMNEYGYPWHKVSLLVGVHDFEQYNRDIFRKSFVYAHKHIKRMKLFLKYWRMMAERDLDYQVALAGLASGVEYYKDVFIDADQPIYEIEYIKKGINEKNELDIGNYSISDIDNLIMKWKEPKAYLENYPAINGVMNNNTIFVINKKQTQRRKSKLKIIHYFRIGIWYIGRLLQKVGFKICTLIES